MIEHHVDSNGVRLHVVEEGEGPALLVLHGFTGDAESMQPVSSALRDHFRVVRLELVGHGKSDVPDTLESYSMAASTVGVLETVRALQLDHPHLLGYSMGGRTALATALRDPSAFSSLVLVGATAGLSDAAERAARIESDEALARSIEEAGLEAFVDRWMALPLFASQMRLGPEALSRARAQRLRNSVAGLAASLRGMGAGAQPPLHDRLPNLDLPVLLVVGDEDEKFQRIAQGLAASLPQAEIASIAGAGHAAHLEGLDQFARRVREFCARSVMEETLNG